MAGAEVLMSYHDAMDDYDPYSDIDMIAQPGTGAYVRSDGSPVG